MINNVSVIGLGKLGACMAACFASKGVSVTGVDLNPKYVEALNRGLAPVEETGLAARIDMGKGRLKAVAEYLPAILETEATFVIVPTPSDAHGGFSLRFAAPAFAEIGRSLRQKEGYHLVVLTSTVLPGATEREILPVLEKESGKKCGADFGLCYSPEFIALGSVIRDFLNPDFVLVGEHDAKAGALLEDFYKGICDNNPPVARMSLANAELTKVAVNSFMTMKISFANMLAGLCEKIPQGDVDCVTKALGLFGGVGSRSLNGGLGYGGPCLPRDNVALSYFAKTLGEEAGIPEAVDRFNRSLVDRVLKRVVEEMKPGARLSVLGLAYKPHTWVIEESQGVALAARLAERGFPVTVYDPQAMDASRAVLKNRVAYAESVEEAVQNADGVIITTPDPVFVSASLLLCLLASHPVKPTVFDIWRLYRDTLRGNPNIKYLAGGIWN